MLDKFYLQGRTEYVDRNITVTENRAPTDESVRLLREMEAKALENILYRGPFEANGLKSEIAVYRDMPTNDLMTVVMFKLNGQEHRVKSTFKTWIGRPSDWATLSLRERFDRFLAQVKTDVANHIAANVLELDAKSLFDPSIMSAFE